MVGTGSQLTAPKLPSPEHPRSPVWSRAALTWALLQGREATVLCAWRPEHAAMRGCSSAFSNSSCNSLHPSRLTHADDRRGHQTIPLCGTGMGCQKCSCLFLQGSELLINETSEERDSCSLPAFYHLPLCATTQKHMLCMKALPACNIVCDE